LSVNFRNTIELVFTRKYGRPIYSFLITFSSRSVRKKKMYKDGRKITNKAYPVGANNDDGHHQAYKSTI